MNEYLQELFSVMMQVKQAFHRLSQQSFEDRSATVLQYSALTFLANNDASTMSTIAAHLQLSLSSATQVIERLVKSGLVRRIDDTKDRRIVHLEITKDGKNELKRMQKKWMEKMGKVFSQIPQKDIKEYIRIQKLVLEKIQKEEYESR